MESITTFDAGQMLRDFAGDHDRFARMAQSVLAEVPHHVAAMRARLDAERHSGLGLTARCMGHLFDSLLAARAGEAARLLEQAVLRDRPSETSAALRNLEVQVDAFLTELRALREAALDA